MGSQIIFLGTAGGRNAVPSQMRASGGIIVQTEGYQFHIDPGPGALLKAREYGVNVQNNNFLITTHHHLDHCNDINTLIEAMTYSGDDKSGILISDESVVNGTEHEHPYLTKLHKSYLDKVITLKPFEKVKLPNMEIHALPTQHRCISTIGIKLVTPQFTISYSSDTKFFPELIKEYEKSDVLILNCMKPASQTTGDHLNTLDCEKIISEVKPKLAILTHFGKNMLKADPVQEARAIQARTGIPTIAAKDGLAIDPLSYPLVNKAKPLY